MATQALSRSHDDLAARFQRVRALSRDIAAPLSDADATIQPHADASPTKWHLAHSTWFFETFVLRDHAPGYRSYDERWAFLFNSYYEAEGPRHDRPRRGMLSRPSLDEVRAYRSAVEDAVLNALPHLPDPVLELVELGLHHEQQHQELMLMDLTAAMAENPLRPAVWPASVEDRAPAGEENGRLHLAGGLVTVGAAESGFAFDAERPQHRQFLQPYWISSRPVMAGEWIEFMLEGGYGDPLLWLADGWAWVRQHEVEAPLYWQELDGCWHRYTLAGLQPVDPSERVCHISYYEADAFARWRGARLPTEAEWETAARAFGHAHEGDQLDAAGPVMPRRPHADHDPFFGGVWEWTASAFLSYPGFKAAEGAVGEYNGKFMCGQMVLRGGSVATPRGHVRPSYRNFFYPHQRWMYSGLRLAGSIG